MAHDRWVRGGIVLVGVAVLAAVLSACKVSLAGSSMLSVASDRSTAVELKCSSETDPCTGAAMVRLGGVVGDPVAFTLPPKGAAWVALTLTDAQYGLLPTTEPVAGEVLVDEAPVGDGEPRSLSVSFARAPIPVAGADLVTAPVAAGPERFLDALGRDLLGIELSASQRSSLVAFVQANRPGVVAFVASSDQWMGQVVDDAYSRVLDRAPSAAERSAGIDEVRSSGAVVGLWASLLGSDEFIVKADSTDAGWVNTAVQRVWFRDPFETERNELIADLAGGATRTQVAAGLLESEEGTQVRAKRWSQKLLSRDPSPSELTAWATTVMASGDLGLIVQLAASDAYDDLAQERTRSATLTAAAATVVVGIDDVVSSEWNDQGTGTITVASSVTPPAIGGHLVIDDPSGDAGGLGRVLAVDPVEGGTRVSVAVASLTDVFVAAEVSDSTEMTDVEVVPPSGGRSRANGDPACTAALSSSIEAEIGIDVRNDSSIEWHWSWARPVIDKVRVAAAITPGASLKVNGLTLDAECQKELASWRFSAPIQAGPITIPGFFEVKTGVGAEMHWQALTMSASLSLPCTVGFEVTDANQVNNVTGCRPLNRSVTVKPLVTGTANAHAYGAVGYHLGADHGGWARARIGLDARIELGLDLTSSTSADPNWTLHAYLDASLDLSGALGPWEFSRNLGTYNILRDLAASNQIGTGTQAGTSTHPSNNTVHPDPPTPGSGTRATSVSSGLFHACAVLQDGGVSCWGAVRGAQFPNGNEPMRVTGVAHVAQVTSGWGFTCARVRSGSVLCWGDNSSGQLGDGSYVSREEAAPVHGLNDAVDISAGQHHMCAVRSDQTVVCWGSNRSVQLGNTWSSGSVPVSVAGVNGALMISSGDNHTCALISQGSPMCWGSNYRGQLGTPEGNVYRPSPRIVEDLPSALSVSASGLDGLGFSESNSCAITPSRTVRCWGSNGFGQLGRGDSSFQPGWMAIEVVDLDEVVQVDVGGLRTCARRSDGAVSCWGATSEIAPRHQPVVVDGLARAVDISVGSVFSCAVTDDGGVWCWGNNVMGVLGHSGPTTDAPSKVDV